MPLPAVPRLPILFTHEEAAVKLLCSPRHIRDLMSRGELGYVRTDVGRCVPDDAILRYIEERRVEAGRPAAPSPQRKRGPKPGSRRRAK